MTAKLARQVQQVVVREQKDGEDPAVVFRTLARSEVVGLSNDEMITIWNPKRVDLTRAD